MDVSENRGNPKSSILIGFSIINHPFWGTPIFGNPHISIFAYDDFYNSKERQDVRLPVVSDHIDSRHPHTFSKN